MGKSHQQDELYLALFLLKTKFNNPIDLVKYWHFAGPCIDPHPAVEDYVEKS